MNSYAVTLARTGQREGFGSGERCKLDLMTFDRTFNNERALTTPFWVVVTSHCSVEAFISITQLYWTGPFGDVVLGMCGLWPYSLSSQFIVPWRLFISKSGWMDGWRLESHQDLVKWPTGMHFQMDTTGCCIWFYFFLSFGRCWALRICWKEQIFILIIRVYACKIYQMYYGNMQLTLNSALIFKFLILHWIMHCIMLCFTENMFVGYCEVLASLCVVLLCKINNYKYKTWMHLYKSF